MRGRSGPRAPSPAVFAASLLKVGVVITVNRSLPETPLWRRAMLDWAAHLATTSLALDAARVRSRPLRRSALVAAVLIDADHIPDAVLGWGVLTRRSARPFTHSILTIAAIVSVRRCLAPRRAADREMLDGVAFGLATHLLRDVTDGTAGAPLLWPLRRRSVRFNPALFSPRTGR